MVTPFNRTMSKPLKPKPTCGFSSHELLEGFLVVPTSEAKMPATIDGSIVDRFIGAAPPDDLKTPFRQIALERIARPDGSLLLRWPQDVCSLTPGAAAPHASLNTVVDNVTDWLGVWARERPETTFMAERREGGEWWCLTYREAMHRILAIGTTLLQRCLHDHADQPATLAILSGNSLRQALLTVAALHVGVPVAPISPSFATAGGGYGRLRLLIDKLRPTLVYSEDRRSAADALETLGLPPAMLFTAADIDMWTRATTDLDFAVLERAHARARGDRMGKIMFTSGSTGTPKGVIMTHSMLAYAQAANAAILDRIPTCPPVSVDWLPWHHVIGGNVNMHRALRFGGTVYLDTGRPVAGKFSETLANLREISPTSYYNVPLGYSLLAPALEADAQLAASFFANLEYMSFGGASLGRDIVGRLELLAKTYSVRRIPVMAGFGATECSGPALGTAWDMESAGAVGLPAPGITLKLVPAGDRYEIRVAGGNVMSSYLGEPALTDAAFDEEGFYRLGDAVRWADPEQPLRGLRYAGRVAEDFKLASGTWVNAGSLRGRVVDAFTPLLRDVVITGHDRAFVGAMCIIDESACRELCRVDGAHVKDLIRHPVLLSKLADCLARFNQNVRASSQRVERLLLLEEAPKIEALEITEKGYINQRAMIHNRETLVNRLYGNPPTDGIVTFEEGTQ